MVAQAANLFQLDKVKTTIGITLIVKCVLLICFSSGYKDELFIPFITHFLEQGGNPWQAFYSSQDDANFFPYPPLMLYLLALFIWPVHALSLSSGVLSNILYGLPLLISDFLIFYTLVRLFPWRKTEIYIFYFISPIILYAVYMHGQLDIIPTALLFAALKLLTDKRYWQGALVLGLAIATKFHIIAALPLIAIYLAGQNNFRAMLFVLIIPPTIYLLLSAPYIDSAGYQTMVLFNTKQKLIFDTFFQIGSLKIYLPIFAIVIIYLRFLAFQKVNNDLLFAMIGALFSVFLLLVIPAPGWYVWVAPFFTVFYIRYFSGYQHYLYFALLSSVYLFYYLSFHDYDMQHLKLFGRPLDLQLNQRLPNANNLVFTLLEAILLATTLHIYKSGIKSNQVYTMEQPFVLGISGDSGTGKSTLLTGLQQMFGNELLQLEGDGDHKWERGNEKWEKITHLNPKANFLHNQADNILELKHRRTVKRVDYMHDTGKFSKEETIKPKNFIVIAGLHALYLPKMRKVIDLKIYLDMEEELRVHWKLKRDTEKRGHSEEKVLTSIKARKPDAEKFIYPQKQFADLIIRYFAADKANLKNQHPIKLGLDFHFDASIPTEDIVKKLKQEQVQLQWDYSENLQTQVFRFLAEPKKINYAELANRYIENANELVSNAHWENGFRGMSQFLTLLVISETLKDKALKHG